MAMEKTNQIRDRHNSIKQKKTIVSKTLDITIYFNILVFKKKKKKPLSQIPSHRPAPT